MTSTSHLSWKRISFISKVMLLLRLHIEIREIKEAHYPALNAKLYSSLSSSYYSVCGTGVAHLRNIFQRSWLLVLAPIRLVVWMFTWLPLVLWCYWRMLPVSNKVVQLLGEHRMTAEQSDVRQSILRRRGMLDEAEACIKKALKKDTGLAESHTIGLLYVGLADIQLRKGNMSESRRLATLAIGQAQQAEQREPDQAARICRHCATIAQKTGDRESADLLKKKARSLATSAGSRDQLLKST